MWECLGLHLQSQYLSVTFIAKIQDSHFFLLLSYNLRKSEQVCSGSFVTISGLCEIRQQVKHW